MKITVTYGAKTGGPIIDLPTAKLNSNIDFNEQDALYQLFLDAIETEIENYTGAPIVARSVVFVADKWESIVFNFPVEVTTVEWLDEVGNATEVSDYDLFAGELTLGDEPEGFHRLKITCTAGYDPMPADIKNAALLMFSERDTYRENRPVKLNTAAQNILRAYKIY